MFVIIGTIVVMASVLVGFTIAGGQVGVLIQLSEFIVIGGIGIGTLLMSSPLPIIMDLNKAVLGTLKGNPYTKGAFSELLKMLYDLFMLARREGLVALEHHAEHPEQSDFFKRYPFFSANHHAVEFMTDTLKVVITGSVQPMDLAEMMDLDLECHHAAALRLPGILQNIGDAMPGYGIVACVLGVIITMGAIGGKPEEIGHHVACALVGTFLGILLAYGVFAPLAQALTNGVNSEAAYLNCIRSALLSFARGDAPLTAVEFARRNVAPGDRCSFSEMEVLLKQATPA